MVRIVKKYIDIFTIFIAIHWISSLLLTATGIELETNSYSAARILEGNLRCTS